MAIIERSIDIMTSSGKGGESLSYLLFDEESSSNLDVVNRFVGILNKISCIDIGIFPADIKLSGERYVPGRQRNKEKCSYWLVSFDGLYGGRIFIIEGKNTVLTLLSSIIISWGQIPFRWRKDVKENNQERIIEKLERIME